MTETSQLPSFLFDADLLVPLKLDITVKGARYVDSFCWNVFNSLLTPEEFAARTCADLSLPPAFQHKIALQITEQVDSFRDIISVLHAGGQGNQVVAEAIPSPIQMMVGLRYNTIDCECSLQLFILSIKTRAFQIRISLFGT